MNQNPSNRPWEKRRERSISLVKQAILNLKASKQEVTVNAIYLETKRIDPQRKGVHPTTYKRNSEVDAIVSKEVGRKPIIGHELNFSHIRINGIKKERDARRALYNLLSKSHKDLAMRTYVLEMEVVHLREELALADLRLLEILKREKKGYSSRGSQRM